MQEHRMDMRTMAVYWILLFATVVVFILGAMSEALGDVLISIPVMIIIIITMVNDKNLIHVPPALIAIVVGVMYISLASNYLDENSLLYAIQNILIGVVLGLTGLIIVYAMMREMPGFDRERPALVSLMVFFFSVAIYALWMLLVYYLAPSEHSVSNINDFMEDMVWVSLGSLLISLIFFAGRSSRFFDETIIRFLKRNSDAIGMQPHTDAELIREIIENGESETVEFKSTLRTNLETGEKDKRMERAVLKTVVAFLNTDGGTLLVGVSDDGCICGIDEESFESRDKMNLHMTNLISSQIGNEFLPFIDFKLVNFENVAAMKVDCRPTEKPVFLREGKIETYFVRSGPSSVELTGMDLINYVNNRKTGKEKKK